MQKRGGEEEQWMVQTNICIIFLRNMDMQEKVQVKNIGLLLNVVFNQILTNNNNI